MEILVPSAALLIGIVVGVAAGRVLLDRVLAFTFERRSRCSGGSVKAA